MAHHHSSSTHQADSTTKSDYDIPVSSNPHQHSSSNTHDPHASDSVSGRHTPYQHPWVQIRALITWLSCANGLIHHYNVSVLVIPLHHRRISYSVQQPTIAEVITNSAQESNNARFQKCSRVETGYLYRNRFAGTFDIALILTFRQLTLSNVICCYYKHKIYWRECQCFSITTF